MQVVETIQVRPSMVLLYNTYIDRPTKIKKSKDNHPNRFSNISKPAYSGELSSHAKKRLARALNLLVAIARPKKVSDPATGDPFTFKVNFVTLTLPSAQGVVTDRDLKKKVFDPFIKSMKRKHGLKSYVWRSERQFNGNLHFHLTTDSFLPYGSIRDEWNRFLSKFHFIDDFHSQHNHFSPNSTDVHSVQDINNIASYMVKYMSKSPEAHLKGVNAKLVALGKNPIDPDSHPFRKISSQPKWDDPIAGKVWDCSINLKLKENCSMIADSESRDDLRKIVRSPSVEPLITDHCYLLLLKKGRIEEVLPQRLKTLYQDYLGRIRNYVRPKKLIVTPDLPVDDFVKSKRYVQSCLPFPQFRVIDIYSPKTNLGSSDVLPSV